LRNDNGVFVDATEEICSSLSKGGMITDAIWTDFDNNGTPDLIVVGEFMPITIYKNTEGILVELENSGISAFSGWWNSIVGADIDKDGDTDYIVGNLGLNNTYNIALDRPLRVYAKDFDNNGSVDPILSCYFATSSGEMEEFPAKSWDRLGEQVPMFRTQFENYKQYAETSMKQLLAPHDTTGMLILEANYPLTSFLENLGDGKFRLKELPRVVQIAPVNGLQVYDVNHDGNLDILLIGNDFGNEIISGRFDALNGMLLLGDGNGGFTPVSSLQSGFVVPGDAKALARLNGNNRDIFLSTQNREYLKIHAINALEDVNQKVFKPMAKDQWAKLVYKNGRSEKVEFYYGAGYLTQSSRAIRISDDVEKLIVHGYDGTTRDVEVSALP
jgi:enediyne biosynthesis protein E4